ncbi:MAG: response regulator [Bryobacterales bacterium]|nr:response regulator [Bryobacterales bacterium]
MRELEEARTQSEQQAYQLLEQSFELARARDQALQGAGRKLHFLVNLSSEFRAPMKGVASMAQMLLDSDLSLQQREFAESVKKAAGRLLETIDEILDYSRIDAGEVKFDRKEFSLRALVADLLHRHAARAEEKGLELATLVKRDVPDALVGDGGRLRQVMSHLVHNAIRMSDSGTVSLTINAVQGNAQEVMLRVQVEDCGAGIPPEVMPVLFDPFARGLGAREQASVGPRDGARERGGSGGGMSLAISKRLVERMGGQMGVESEPGQGSLFWFQVSLARGAAATDLEPAAVLAGQRCLIVHDGVSVRGAIAEMMGHWGMQAVTASDGPQALAMLRQAELLGERFDVLLVDSELPGSPGIALADGVIEDPGCGRPGIVLLVPYSQRAYCAEPTFVGISATLPKPVEERALRACLARLQAREARPAHAVTHSLHQLHEATRGESGKRVLLVDDDPIGRRVGQRLLEKLGYEAVVAGGGREAVQAVQGGRFAAVLMDMMMPELDGCAATRTIRELAGVDRALPIIAMTASDAASHRERCLEAGMNDFLCKPATLDELRTVLHRWTTIDREAATV